MIQLHQRDCLTCLPQIADHSIDAIITDPPYGSTNLKWDTRIDPVAMWLQFQRVIKPKGAIVVFADFRFAVEMVNAAPKGWFRYDLIWSKSAPAGFLNANRQPLRSHETILVFASGQTTYHPQMGQGKVYAKKNRAGRASHYGKHRRASIPPTDKRFPKSILDVPKPHPSPHPTAKPLDLISWLVKTYTDPGETVLDPTMGSGTTGVACVLNQRHFVGIESDPKIYKAAAIRVCQTQYVENQLKSFPTSQGQPYATPLESVAR